MEPVHSDPEYYSRIFKVYQEKDTDTEINKKWLKENVMGLVDQCVRENETPAPLKVLSLGCGAGDKDGLILDQLTKKYKSIDYTALDPNNEQISHFKTNITESDKFQNVSFHLLEETADEYMKREHPSQSFNFIHMIHMLYHVDNVQETIAHYFQRLSPGGIMLIFIGNKASGHLSVVEKFKGQLVKGDGFAYLFSDNIAQALEALELPYQKYPLIHRCDITATFTDTEEGQMLLDFLTGVINFRKTAPPEIVTKFCDELTKISFKEDGRLFINNASDAFSIQKPFDQGDIF